MVVTKAPKRCHFSASSNLEARVDCAVAQKNIGDTYITRVNEAVGLSSGQVYEEYAFRRDTERKRHMQYSNRRDVKMKKIERKLKKTKDRCTKELREGITYQPTIDTRSQQADILHIPTAIFPPAVERVKECSYNKVFCDIETSSLQKEADILQISAICDSDTVDQYITPTQSVSPAATAVTGLTSKGGVLFHHGVPVSTLPLQSALQLFMAWLDEQSPVILIGHNFRAFNFPRIIRAVGIAKLRSPFAVAVIGAVDTLPLMKSIHPNRNSYRQETLVSDVLQETYEAHNAMADVISLQKLFSASHVSEDLAYQHSFTTSWAFKMFDYQQQADKNMYTMTNIINGNVITKCMANKIGKSGLRLDHLQLAFDRGGIDGLSQILSERVDRKIRVTSSKRVIASLSSHFDK